MKYAYVLKPMRKLRSYHKLLLYQQLRVSIYCSINFAIYIFKSYRVMGMISSALGASQSLAAIIGIKYIRV